MVRGKMTKPSGKGEVMGRYFMSVFFTSPELIGTKLSTNGKPGQKVLPQAIIESILGELNFCPFVFAITQEQG
jgi:hypothetical protein